MVVLKVIEFATLGVYVLLGAGLPGLFIWTGMTDMD